MAKFQLFTQNTDAIVFHYFCSMFSTLVYDSAKPKVTSVLKDNYVPDGGGLIERYANYLDEIKDGR